MLLAMGGGRGCSPPGVWWLWGPADGERYQGDPLPLEVRQTRLFSGGLQPGLAREQETGFGFVFSKTKALFGLLLLLNESRA